MAQPVCLPTPLELPAAVPLELPAAVPLPPSLTAEGVARGTPLGDCCFGDVCDGRSAVRYEVDCPASLRL